MTLARDSYVSTRASAVVLTFDPRTGRKAPFKFHRVVTAEPDVIVISQDRARAMGV